MPDLTMTGPGTGRGRTRRRAPAALALGALAASTVLTAAGPPTRADASATRPARVAVDFGSAQGRLPQTERYNNFGNVTAWPEQRADDVAFLNRQGLHGKVYRVWGSSPNAPAEDNVFDQCHLATRTCDFSTLDAYLTEASRVSDSVMVNLNPTEFVEGKRPFRDLEPMLELIIGSLKKKYPRIRYVEAFNEPDWQFHGQARHAGSPADRTTLQPDGLYRFYRPFYQAVDQVDRKVRRGGRIQVGGPALSFLDRKWVQPFLDSYAADRDHRKRLDFLSYHAYLKWDDDYRVPTLYNGDLRVVASDRTTIVGWLKQNHLSTRIPSFVTETGLYPGPAYDDPDQPANDYIRQAAGMATYNYWFSNQPDTYMFNWCVRHREEQRKDQLVTRTPGGPILDTFTPYGNVMLMQSKMKSTRVSAVSNALNGDNGDNGVYALASKDGSGASLMVWNWQHTHTDAYRTTIDMTRLPADLRHGPVRERVYRIDQTTGNYFTDPAKAALQLVDEKTIAPGRSHTQTIDLGPNAIYLILLEGTR